MATTITNSSKNKVPQSAWISMNPKTRELILLIWKTKAGSISFRSKNSHEARIRQKALRRARARGYIKFKSTQRQGVAVTVTLR